ncbi:MAG TPA: peptidoglycan-binding domain-containing protein [Nitrospiraceae bacterium]
MSYWEVYFDIDCERLINPDIRYHVAVKSIQQELNQNDIQTPVTGSYDEDTAASVKTFQRRNDLRADGIVGYHTARKLLLARMDDVATRMCVPFHILSGTIRVESRFDFAAIGLFNQHHRGLGIKDPHTNDELAYDSPYSVNEVGKIIAKNLNYFSDADCAIAAFNTGAHQADTWGRSKDRNGLISSYVADVRKGAFV